MKKNPVVHFEMPTKDKKRTAKFYKEVFGWEMNQLGEEMGHYLMAHTAETDDNGMNKTPGTINGGFFDWSKKDSVPHLVISVDDIKKQIKVVKKAGGKILGPTMDIPGIGKFAMFKDTEGNKVGMLQPVEI